MALSTEQVINQFTALYRDRYDYSQVNYVKGTTPVKVLCNQCKNTFFVAPVKHKYSKHECQQCYPLKGAIRKATTREEVIERFKIKHGSRFDYSKFTYHNNTTPSTIICSEHGEFEQSPRTHYKHGCLHCGNAAAANKRRKSTEEIIKRFKAKHHDIYNYDRVIYVGYHDKVAIQCKVHGIFWQTPNNHLKWNCNKCRTNQPPC